MKTNRPTTTLPTPLSSPVDILLADIAIRVQLSRSDYEKAVQRYQVISEWIERDGSQLKDRVDLFYPQGSMATESTIASKLRTDEFDIDIAAQIDFPVDVTPRQALDLLHTAIRGEPGSRYHEMTTRRTRCVTVSYSDNMHLDVTPMLRRQETPARESWIFHYPPEAPREPDFRCVANPYGFTQWFQANTPPDKDFAIAYASRTLDYERIVMATADSDPVPPQAPPSRKSKAVIVLQLLKRWRNVQYDARFGRRPPSVMLSRLVADGANSTDSLSEELLHQAQSMLAEFARQHVDHQLVRVVNPVCRLDVLTDRWPGSFHDQETFIRDLRKLITKVQRLISGCALDEMKKIMAELFGEAPTADAFRSFNQQFGDQIRRGRSQHRSDVGKLIVPAVATGESTTILPGVKSTPRHTFYGGNEFQ